MPFGILACQVEILAHLMARFLVRWHVKMESWHAFGTLACGHINHAGTQARWHVDHI